MGFMQKAFTDSGEPDHLRKKAVLMVHLVLLSMQNYTQCQSSNRKLPYQVSFLLDTFSSIWSRTIVSLMATNGSGGCHACTYLAS